MSYRPRVSPEYAEQIRRWHERSYELAQAEGAEGQTFEYLGRTITVPPDVQPITRMAHLLGRAVLDEVRAGDRVLDMGTGSGVNAILAASKAAHVLAVDISASAVAAARVRPDRLRPAVPLVRAPQRARGGHHRRGLRRPHALLRRG